MKWPGFMSRDAIDPCRTSIRTSSPNVQKLRGGHRGPSFRHRPRILTRLVAEIPARRIAGPHATLARVGSVTDNMFSEPRPAGAVKTASSPSAASPVPTALPARSDETSVSPTDPVVCLPASLSSKTEGLRGTSSDGPSPTNPAQSPTGSLPRFPDFFQTAASATALFPAADGRIRRRMQIIRVWGRLATCGPIVNRSTRA
jgi:hypothetical protein